MTRKDKQKLIDYLSQEFKNANAIVISDYKGLNVKDIESLRNESRESDIKVKVIKNTLASLAFKNAQIQGFEIKDANIFLWGNNQVSLAKIVAKFSKENDRFAIKQGYCDGYLLSQKDIEAISNLPSKEELISMLLSVWSAPLRNMAFLLNVNQTKLLTAINNLKNKKEKGEI